MGYLYSKFTRYCCSGGGNSSKNQNQAIKNTEGHGLKRIATGDEKREVGLTFNITDQFSTSSFLFRCLKYETKSILTGQKGRRRTTLFNSNSLNFLRKCLANSICLLISATSTREVPCYGSSQYSPSGESTLSPKSEIRYLPQGYGPKKMHPGIEVGSLFRVEMKEYINHG